MDVREKLVKQAISHFWYGVSHDIFSEPVTTYAKLAIEALEKEKESGVTVQELDSCDFCKKFDFAGARAEVNKYGAYISLAICNTKFPDDERFKFCPVCGRRLPQPPKAE